MKIKSSGQSFYWKGMVGVLALIGLVVVLTMVFSEKKEVPEVEHQEAVRKDDKAFLSKPASLMDVLSQFKNKEIFIGVFDEASTKFTKENREEVKKIGGEKLSMLGFRNGYAGYFYNGEFVKEDLGKKKAATLTIDGDFIKSAGADNGNYCKFVVDGVTYHGKKRGLHLFIKTGHFGQVFHYVFDFFEKENPLSTGVLGNGQHPDLEQIELVLDEKAFRKISKKRKDALRQDLLMTGDDDLVNGTVIYDGKPHRVETRLKGDWTDHLRGEKWSFRVKMRDEETILGMKKFSLHHPRTRNYAGEWLFHQLLQEQGILNLKYKFVQFWLKKTVNGVPERVNLGIYALEESFDKQLFERQKRRAGLILKLDESVFWEERAEFMQEGIKGWDLRYIDFMGFEDYNIIPFAQKTVMKDPVLRDQFNVARDLLQSYMKGERKASEVFDLEKLVNYNAICNLLGTYHAMIPHNWRLYYNPITSRLEPIGFDANGLEKAWKLFIYEWADKDVEFLRQYNRKIQELVETRAFEQLKDYPGFATQMEYMQRENKGIVWDEKVLENNFVLMKTTVLPKKSINVFLKEFNRKQAIFSVENYGKMPVELSNIQHIDNRVFGTLVGNNLLMAGEKRMVVYQLDKNFEKLFVNKKKKKSGFNLQNDLKKIQLQWNTIGTTVERMADIFPWLEEDPQLKATFFERRAPQEIPEHPFLEVDEENKIINWKSGVWKLKKDLKFPAGYVLKIGAGCHIELLNDYSQIISYSPVQIVGTKEDPVRITSATGKGGGIFVTGSRDTSIVRHCVFDGLGVPKAYQWSLSGAVNFFENPVKISDAVFKNNRTEDGLNIINTWFDMKNVAFANTQSDAFDGDFVEGTISNSTFRNIGNDAIDVSGSNITVKKVVIMKAGDKGLSAGENSKMIAEDVLVQDSEVAIASKDLSKMIGNQLVLRNNKLGFTAFQKKPEFGACQIEATNILLENNELNHLIERNSSLILNGQLMPVSDGVKERMYGAEFGKSSR